MKIRKAVITAAGPSEPKLVRPADELAPIT